MFTWIVGTRKAGFAQIVLNANDLQHPKIAPRIDCFLLNRAPWIDLNYLQSIY